MGNSFAGLRSFGKSASTAGFRVDLLGRSAAGREDVRLEWEVKPIGTAFGKTGHEFSAAALDTGSSGTGGSFVPLNEQISGLAPSTLYHWRVRVITANPLFPRSPWLSVQGNTVTESKLRTGP